MNRKRILDELKFIALRLYKKTNGSHKVGLQSKLYPVRTFLDIQTFIIRAHSYNYGCQFDNLFQKKFVEN